MMQQVGKTLFNCLTLVFTLLTFGAVALIAGIAGDAIEPPAFKPEPTEAPPTLALLQSPTPRPSWTPSATLRPSNTPSETPTITLTPSETNTPTHTPTITNTPGPTDTFTPPPTDTPVPPTDTPTATLTWTPSPTATFTPSPTGPTPTPSDTPSPYAFIIQTGTPLLRDNFANAAGCNWQGIGGQATTNTGSPVTGVQVRVTGAAIGERATLTGTNQAYGPAGWEIALGTAPSSAFYQVALYSPEGEQLSPSIEIVFPGSCQQNLALINFIQTRPF